MKRAIIAAAALAVALAGCKASQPGSIEGGVVREIKQQVTIGGKDWKNPIPKSDAVIQEGASHFQHHCQICHGLDGQNTGVPFADKMDPPVPELTSKDVQDYSDGQLKWIIENGIAPSGMPAWRGLLSDDEMWKIVHYIRNLPPKGSLGAPDVYKEEAEAHTHTQQQGQKGAKPHPHAPGTKEHKH